MIRKTEHTQKTFADSGIGLSSAKKHIETHKVTSIWFLFILIYRKKELLNTTL